MLPLQVLLLHSGSKEFQRVIGIAEKAIEFPLPSLEDLYSSYCFLRANSIMEESSHPGHSLFMASAIKKMEHGHKREDQ